MLCVLLLFECLYYIGLDVRKPVFGGWRTTNSVGRCVIPFAFFGKNVKHTFSCRECILFKKKDVYNFALAI